MTGATLHPAKTILRHSASDEWHTPADIIDAARRTLGRIDLDPASSPADNTIVCARHYFTQADNGLMRPWFQPDGCVSRVWLNPPCGRTGDTSNQELYTRKLLAEYRVGNVREAILLVDAATDTSWFKLLWDFPICFPHGRLRSWRPDGLADSPTHGSAVVYLGYWTRHFASVFRNVGTVVCRMGGRL